MHFSTSSDLYTPTTKAIYEQFESSTSTPEYYINGVNEMEYSTQGDNVTQSKTNGANAVNAAWQSQPIANVGFDFTVSGNSLTVNSKTRFFTDTTGEYYVAAYISLDNLYAEQNLQGQGYIDRWQNKVIQFAMTTGSNFGMQAFNGSITSDTEADETFTYNLDASWVRSDVWAVCMIWKKVGTKYVYVNCTQKRVAEPTGILQAAEILHVKVYPTVSAGSIRVEADVQQAGGMLTVTV
ncbi:MAG: Omp28-related outer membrane protein [Chitinophagales bacterium]|nr:Omp28-related outer membrane protein [Chitinophagales bacterium]